MEFQLSYFKSWKMMLWKCCTQYASKFGKLSRGHRTGKDKFSFQSPKKRQWQKTFKLPYNFTHLKHYQNNAQNSPSQTSTVHKLNFQMFKLDLEKAAESEIKLPTSVESSRKQESSRKNIYFCFIDYAKAFDCVDHNKLWKILSDGNTRPSDLLPEKSVYRSGSNS